MKAYLQQHAVSLIVSKAIVPSSPRTKQNRTTTTKKAPNKTTPHQTPKQRKEFIFRVTTPAFTFAARLPAQLTAERCAVPPRLFSRGETWQRCRPVMRINTAAERTGVGNKKSPRLAGALMPAPVPGPARPAGSSWTPAPGTLLRGAAAPRGGAAPAVGGAAATASPAGAPAWL